MASKLPFEGLGTVTEESLKKQKVQVARSTSSIIDQLGKIAENMKKIQDFVINMAEANKRSEESLKALNEALDRLKKTLPTEKNDNNQSNGTPVRR